MSDDSTALVSLSRQFTLTENGLRIQGGPSLADCQECFRALVALERSVQFAIGDLLNYVEVRHKKDYQQIAEATRLNIKTLQNYKSVSAAVAPSLRREKLSWSHHAVVSRCPPTEQRAYLVKAERERWTVEDLSEQVREKHLRHNGAHINVGDYLCDDCLARLATLERREWVGLLNSLSHTLGETDEPDKRSHRA